MNRASVAARLGGMAPAALIWLCFFALPVGFFLIVSFWRVRAYRLTRDFTIEQYVKVVTDYGGVLAYTFMLAFGIALGATALGLVAALYIRFRAGRLATTLLWAVMLTLFGGYLSKIYAWKIILGNDGVMNASLIALGIVGAPLNALIYSPGAVAITLVHYLVPVAALPIYGALRGIGDLPFEAARDLGAHPLAAIRDVVLPQCRAGIATAFAACFFLAAGDYVAPTLVGGTQTSLIGTFIQSQFGHRLDQPLGAAMSFTVIGLGLLIVGVATVVGFRMLRGAR